MRLGQQHHAGDPILFAKGMEVTAEYLCAGLPGGGTQQGLESDCVMQLRRTDSVNAMAFPEPGFLRCQGREAIEWPRRSSRAGLEPCSGLVFACYSP